MYFHQCVNERMAQALGVAQNIFAGRSVRCFPVLPSCCGVVTKTSKPLKGLAHPTQFERVTFAFGGQTSPTEGVSKSSYSLDLKQLGGLENKCHQQEYPDQESVAMTMTAKKNLSIPANTGTLDLFEPALLRRLELGRR